MKAAYIGRIYIENFHAFQGKNEIPIIKDDGTLQQWTVIVGENNSGKTSLLKVLTSIEPTTKFFINGERPYEVVPAGMSHMIKLENGVSKKEFSIGCNFWLSDKPIVSIRNSRLINLSKEVINTYHWGYTVRLLWNDVSYEEVENKRADKLTNFKIYGYGVSRRVSSEDNTNDDKLSTRNSLTLLYSTEQ